MTPTAGSDGQKSQGGSAATNSDEKELPLDEEAKQLKLAQVKAEARKAIAEANKAELAAQLPTSDIKPLEGKVDVGDKVGLIADLLAHSLLAPAANTVAASVRHKIDNSSRVLIVDDRNLTNIDWPYAAVRLQLDKQLAALDSARGVLSREVPEDQQKSAAGFEPKMASVAALPLLQAAPAVIGTAAAIVGMFQSDYAIKARDVTIGTTPLVAAVARELMTGTAKVVVSGFHAVADSQVVSDFWAGFDKRGKLEQLRLLLHSGQVVPADQRIEDLRAQVKQARDAFEKALVDGKDDKILSNLRGRVNELGTQLSDEEMQIASKRAIVAIADAVVARFDAFATAVTTAKEGAAYPPLVAAGIQEGLRAKSKKISHVLYVGVEAAGGETITRRALFRWSGTVGFLGGAQVSYLLLDVAEGTTVAAGSEPLLANLKYNLGDGTVEPVKPVTVLPSEVVDQQAQAQLEKRLRAAEQDLQALKTRVGQLKV